MLPWKKGGIAPDQRKNKVDAAVGAPPPPKVPPPPPTSYHIPPSSLSPSLLIENHHRGKLKKSKVRNLAGGKSEKYFLALRTFEGYFSSGESQPWKRGEEGNLSEAFPPLFLLWDTLVPDLRSWEEGGKALWGHFPERLLRKERRRT